MFDFFRAIDDILIDRIFERFSHWFQRLTGKTCFFLAKWSFITTLSMFGFMLIENGEKFLNMHPFIKMSVGAYVTALVIAVVWCERQDQQWAMETRPFLNKNRIEFADGRVLILCFILINLVLGIVDGFLWFHCFGIYFFSCTPLPPSKSKAQKFWELLLTKADEALSLGPQPVPARN